MLQKSAGGRVWEHTGLERKRMRKDYVLWQSEFQRASGSTLEDLINRTNEQYREKGLALIQKVPTPITPIKIDKENRHITLAYFDQKSTVDYIGAVQGIPVCFDAKECNGDTFSLQNIHEHQVKFMEQFEQQGGMAFLIIFYTTGTRSTICPMTICAASGTGPPKEEEKASGLKRWTRASASGRTTAYWCLTWKRFSLTWSGEGIDRRGKVSYNNRDCLTLYHTKARRLHR